MDLRRIPGILIAAMLLSTAAANGQSPSEADVLKEVERQLRDWQRQGRAEDIRIIGSQQSELMKQVRAGHVDLQAIVDDYNDNHRDGKTVGQQKSETNTPPASAPGSTPAAPVGARLASSSVPPANRPVAAYTYLENQWRGFPAILSKVAKQAYVFPNGNTVYCANWDPRQLKPTPGSVGKVIPKCDVLAQLPEGKKTKGFDAGQRIDLSFGNVSASGRDLGAGSSSTISGSTLRMTRDGKIEIGKFNAFSINSGGNGAGGGNRKRALRGEYELEGHLIRIEATDGESLVGFISWSSNAGSDSIDHVFINGEHFWHRDD